MSTLTKGRKKKVVEEMLGQEITNYEWSEAKKHAVYPGIGLPVQKVIHRRCRLSMDAVQLFFDLLSDNIQRYAFGTKIVELMSGEMKTIESVRTSRQFQDIFVLYIQTVLAPGLKNIVQYDDDDSGGKHTSYDSGSSNGLLEARSEQRQDLSGTQDEAELWDLENSNSYQSNSFDLATRQKYCMRCNMDARETVSCEKKAFGLPCIKPVGHEGSHRYTTSSMLSRTTCLRIMEKLSAGSIKSLAGLDDEDVCKGRNNFIQLRSIVEHLKALCPSTQSSGEKIIQMIHEVECFHKAGFIDHIKDSSNTMFKCCCLPCGFYANDDAIPCAGIHRGVCSKCQESFSIFPLIDEMMASVKENIIVDLDDELLMYEHQLKTCRQNLIDFRAHLVLKYDEKEAEKQQLLSLEDNQAIVISDWKMKILEAFHRETQVQFFGKRGTSLLGFMVVTNDQDISEIDTRKAKNIHFISFLPTIHYKTTPP